VTGCHDYAPGRRIDFMPRNARLQGLRACLDGLDDRREGAADRFGRSRLTGPAHVPHPLHVRTVAILHDAEINVHQMSGLNPQVGSRLAVPGFRVRSSVDDGTRLPLPSRGEAPLLELSMDLVGNLCFADSGPYPAPDQADDFFGRRRGGANAIDLGR